MLQMPIPGKSHKDIGDNQQENCSHKYITYAAFMLTLAKPYNPVMEKLSSISPSRLYTVKSMELSVLSAIK